MFKSVVYLVSVVFGNSVIFYYKLEVKVYGFILVFKYLFS